MLNQQITLKANVAGSSKRKSGSKHVSICFNRVINSPPKKYNIQCSLIYEAQNF